MTTQIHDSILLQNKKYSIVEVNGNELFNPVHFDLHPYSNITSYELANSHEYVLDTKDLGKQRQPLNFPKK